VGVLELLNDAEPRWTTLRAVGRHWRHNARRVKFSNVTFRAGSHPSGAVVRFTGSLPMRPATSGRLPDRSNERQIEYQSNLDVSTPASSQWPKLQPELRTFRRAESQTVAFPMHWKELSARIFLAVLLHPQPGAPAPPVKLMIGLSTTSSRGGSNQAFTDSVGRLLGRFPLPAVRGLSTRRRALLPGIGDKNRGS